MSVRNISWWVKEPVRRADNLAPLCADCHEIWEPQPLGTLRACPALYRDCFAFAFTVFFT